MPYSIIEQDGEYCVIKDGTEDIEGCHDTREEAEKQLAALNINVEHAADIDYSLIRVKAVLGGDEWALDVLSAPYGGPNRGKDQHGEYFSPNTNFYEADGAPLPLVVYYHGHGPDGKPQGEPEIIGRAVKQWRDGSGLWHRVILDQTKALSQRVWNAAKQGVARASTGLAGFMGRVARDGEITNWLIGELSIWDATSDRRPANDYAIARPATKAYFLQHGFNLDLESDTQGAAAQGGPLEELSETNDLSDHSRSKTNMADNTNTAPEPVDVQAIIDAKISEALAAQEAARVKAAELQQAEEERVQAAVAAEREKWEAEQAASRRLPSIDAPNVAKFANLWQYDNYGPAELAFGAGILSASNKQPSENLLKAVAVRTLSEENEKPMWRTRAAMQQAGMPVKANELNQSTLASYGDEWVGVAYSTQLWDQVRTDAMVAGRLPSIEVPQGMESITIPLSSTPPTFYKVAQASAQDTNTLGKATYTVTSSKQGTANQSITVGKMGARTLFTGELAEDSLIPWLPELMRTLQLEGAHVLDSLIIDGDTATGATTNINDIAGTPGGTEYWLIADGFRKLALVTNTANSRSAGALSINDYLETIKLMGTAGKYAYDTRAVSFIVDAHTHWKSLELTEVKSRDVFAQPTIESGRLMGIWGYEVITSYDFHKPAVGSGYELKANTSGKIDQDTDANNTTGSILAVRWDQWRLAWKRRMTIETQRIPQADATDVVLLMRVGLKYRDTDACAISYGVTV